MAKPFALGAALLLAAACGTNDPAAPTADRVVSDPLFVNNTTGCTTAAAKTAGTEGQAHVAVACTKGQGQGQ